jgi:uncharacterized protein (TIGR00369 family)
VNAFWDRVSAFREGGSGEELLEQIPFARFLNLRVGVEEGRVRCTLPFSEDLVGNPALPALHGGATAALLESACLLQILLETQILSLPETIGLTVAYPRSGRPQDTHAQGLITRLGRRVVHVRAEAWQGHSERPIATAEAHFLIRPEPRG